MENSGLITLLPTFIVLATAILTNRPVAALITGVVIGILLVSPENLLGSFSDITLSVMQDPQIGWIIMVCGLMGSLFYLLIAAFTDTMSKKANTINKSPIITWLL